jgi:23S rRNA (uracil1939-C5)-methyltransferase
MAAYIYICRMGKRKKFIVENVTIQNYAAEGKCIARVDDKVIFVSGAVPGDVVDLFVTKSKKDYGEAIVQRFISYSPNRQEPRCTHFKQDSCGGCKWQMLPYALQLQYKEQQVKDVLTRIGRVKDAEYLPLKGAESEYLYRNKLEFTFSNKRYLNNQQVNNDAFSPLQDVLGFHAPRLFDKVIDITECHLMAPFQNELRNAVKRFTQENNYTYYDHRNHEGEMRNMMIRITTTNEILVNIIFGKTTQERVEQLMNYVASNFPQITSLHYTINTKLNDTLYDLPIHLFKGAPHITERLEDFVYKISTKSFFQTNTRQGEQLYTIAREFAALTGKEVLYDLYCGTGSIGIFCSKQVAKVIGVESIPDAIEDAKQNAAANNLQNSEWYAGDVIKICNTDFFDKHGHPDVVITDPPRAGMHATLIEKLIEIGAQRIVYVSCNPATQARDLALLAMHYTIAKVQAVDMFPQTHHVESVALLLKK